MIHARRQGQRVSESINKQYGGEGNSFQTQTNVFSEREGQKH